MSQIGKPFQVRLAQRSRNQKNRIGMVSTGLDNLVLINRKVLTQAGQVHRVLTQSPGCAGCLENRAHP